MVSKENNIDFQLLFESLTGFYLILSPSLNLLAISNGFVDSINIKKEDIIGKHLFDIDALLPNRNNENDFASYCSSLYFVLNNKTPHSIILKSNFNSNSDSMVGKRFWRYRNTPVMNSSNNIEYITHFAEDVTDILGLKKEHISKEGLLESYNNLNKSFLKTPLELELLKKNYDIEQNKTKRKQKKINSNKDHTLNNTESQVNSDKFVESGDELIKLHNFIHEFYDGIDHKVSDNKLESLIKNIEEYKTVLDETSILAVTDLKGKIQHVNENFCKISKYSKEELIGKDHRIINSGYHSKEFFSDLWTTISSGKVWRGELKNRAKDGTFYWVDTSIFPFAFENGAFSKYLAARIDITKHKEYIDELIIREENYRNLFDNSLVGICLMNMTDETPISINETWVKLFGYKSEADYLKNYNSRIHHVEMEDKMQISDYSESNNTIQELKKLDGTHFWVKLFVKLNHDKTLAQIVIVDVTEQIRTQEKLEEKVKDRTFELTKLLNNEKEFNQLKSRFLTMASHEFRTPLSSILSSTSLIEMYTQTEQQDKRVKHINRIYSSINNLTGILSDFLSIGELENGLIKIEYIEFNMLDFLESIVGELDGMIKQKAQHINFFHHGETSIKQSKKTIRSILLNLLSNASKYSQSNKEIQIISKIEDKKLIISVEDFGIGIPLEDQKFLFNEFFRAKNVENIQGTGIGLSIVKKCVVLLNGSIDFTSKLNEGTVFTIELPLT